jgi:hypothetical protein
MIKSDVQAIHDDFDHFWVLRPYPIVYEYPLMDR